MRNKLLKKLISVCAVFAMCASTAVLPVNAADKSSVLSRKTTLFSDMAPYTMYLQSGEITYQRLNSSTMRVQVMTDANSNVQSIYHDVVIYKNGTEVYRNRLSTSNDNCLYSYLDFSASSGDFFSTYVVHYVSHKGYTEHCDSHHDSTFY